MRYFVGIAMKKSKTVAQATPPSLLMVGIDFEEGIGFHFASKGKLVAPKLRRCHLGVM